MKFLYFVCRDATIPARPGEIAGAVDTWLADVGARHVLVEGQPLTPPSMAVTVRVRDGRVLDKVGPFAATSEQIVGFDIVECPSVEDAVDEARRHPMAPFGAIEVRAFNE